VVANDQRVTLSDIWEYISGTKWVPLSARYHSVLVNSISSETGNLLMPQVSTCIGTLDLPVVTCLQDMKKSWILALENGRGFFLEERFNVE